MSVFKIFSGLGAIGITGVSLYFGLLQKQENDKHQIKIAKYKKIAQTAKGLIDNNNDLKGYHLEVIPPDSSNWGKRRASLYKYKLNELKKAFPSDVIEDSRKFEDYCFLKIEERMDDLKAAGTDDSLQTYFFGTGGNDVKKLFWEYCVPTQNEINELSKSN